MDLPRYSKGLFGMYGGEEVDVSLLCENSMAAVFIDRFGKDITLIREDNEHFSTRVNVSASDQFPGWIIALGKGVKITGPETMVEAMKKKAKELAEMHLE